MDGDRYERGHHTDGGPFRVWSRHGWGTVTSVVTTWMGTVTSVVTIRMGTVMSVVTTWMEDSYELSFASVLRFVSELHYAQILRVLIIRLLTVVPRVYTKAKGSESINGPCQN